MSEQLNARITLGNHLSRAIEKQEFFLLFQPLFDLQSDKVVGVEALIRWRHPTLGLVSPGVFITIAEESGLIGEITIWVLGESLKVLKMLREMNPQLYMSVNISAQELVTPQVLTQHIEAALARFDLPGNALELELTERVFLDYPEMAINVIQTWKSQGIRLAIDDFGTGFSSLNYLLNLPMDTLKIDRSFVKSIHSNERKQGVVKTILALGENLGATCVAEGVEEKEQLDFLRQLGCQKIQGFFLARPMPAEQVVQLLVQQEEHSDQGDAVWSQAA